MRFCRERIEDQGAVEIRAATVHEMRAAVAEDGGERRDVIGTGERGLQLRRDLRASERLEVAGVETEIVRVIERAAAVPAFAPRDPRKGRVLFGDEAAEPLGEIEVRGPLDGIIGGVLDRLLGRVARGLEGGARQRLVDPVE